MKYADQIKSENVQRPVGREHKKIQSDETQYKIRFYYCTKNKRKSIMTVANISITYRNDPVKK